LTFHSNDLFAPWWLLYVPPEGTTLRGDDARCEPSGFLGYKHLIEHQFRQFSFVRDASQNEIVVPQGDPLIVGANVDHKLDQGQRSFVQPVLSLLENELGCVVYRRHDKDSLDRAMSAEEIRDHIIYFCCHADIEVNNTGTRSHQLLLSDGEPIRESDFRDWLLDRSFSTNPLVFMNTCHGGLMSSQFYTAIGPTLMEARANCMIGPQLEIPAVFACAYAISLLGQFIGGEPLGTVIRDLAKAYFDLHRNPLGLVFGSYAGLDARVVRQPA
jgi:hypothetical protein